MCPNACGFIHNYSRYLKPKLKYADGPGCLWTSADHRLYSQVSPGWEPHTQRVIGGIRDGAMCNYFDYVRVRGTGDCGLASYLIAASGFRVRRTVVVLVLVLVLARESGAMTVQPDVSPAG